MDTPNDTPTFAPMPASASASASSDALRKKANSRRATKACLKCRRRKVRCDVTRTGGPCTNCRLDDAPCEVASRAPRKFEIDLVPASPSTQFTPMTAPRRDRDSHLRLDEHSSAPRDDETTPQQLDFLPDHDNPNPVIDPAALMMDTGMDEVHYASSSSSGSHGFQLLDLIEDMDTHHPLTTTSADPGWTNWASICNGGMVEDRVFLDFRGCFMVPARPILNEFINTYFSYIHPLLPMIGRDSGFGQLLARDGQRSSLEFPSSGWVSGLLLQSILFAACPYVSEDAIKALGYSSHSAAKQSFYERARLLFDFDTELDHVTVAQSALLLTYWHPNPSINSKQHVNTAWLRIAIEHARAAGADKASQSELDTKPGAPKAKVNGKNKDTLRRLWWCCIIRDRIMPLCTRRAIQITDANFDFKSHAPLSIEELADDTGASKVHDAVTRRSLATIFVSLAELCLVLTEVCSLIYPAETMEILASRVSQEALLSRHRLAQSRLSEWSQKAGKDLARVLDAAEAERARGSDQATHVILQANLLRIYYHATVVALSNFKLQLATRAIVDRPLITNTSWELCSSAVAIVNSMQRLLELRVANRLPSSVVACIALPFALHIMAVKHYDSLYRDYPRFSKAWKASGSRLSTLMETMKECNAKYEGVEWISEVTLAALPGLEAPAGSPDTQSSRPGASEEASDDTVSSEETVNYLKDLITQNPLVYVRLSMTLDLGLRLDRMPQASDFPQHLQHKLFPGRSSLYETPLEAPFSGTSAPSVSTEADMARDRLISGWVENDRSLFYLHEIGLAP